MTRLSADQGEPDFREGPEIARRQFFLVGGKSLCIVSANPGAQRLLGDSLDDLLSLRMPDIAPVFDEVEWQALIRGSGDEPAGLEAPLRRKDGTEFSACIHLERMPTGGEPLVHSSIDSLAGEAERARKFSADP